MTRKVILYIATSLDGFIADSKGGIDWLHANAIEKETDTSYEDFYSNVDTVIMGRTTYDQVTEVLSPNEYPYADSQSYVLTSRQTESTETITFTDKPIVDIVTNLKKQPGKDIFIVGGASIIKPLVDENLFDEYQLAIIPTLLSEGIPLFSDIKGNLKLTATQAKVVNNIVYHTYVKN